MGKFRFNLRPKFHASGELTLKLMSLEPTVLQGDEGIVLSLRWGSQGEDDRGSFPALIHAGLDALTWVGVWPRMVSQVSFT